MGRALNSPPPHLPFLQPEELCSFTSEATQSPIPAPLNPPRLQKQGGLKRQQLLIRTPSHRSASGLFTLPPPTCRQETVLSRYLRRLFGIELTFPSQGLDQHRQKSRGCRPGWKSPVLPVPSGRRWGSPGPPGPKEQSGTCQLPLCLRDKLPLTFLSLLASLPPPTPALTAV